MQTHLSPEDGSINTITNNTEDSVCAANEIPCTYVHMRQMDLELYVGKLYLVHATKIYKKFNGLNG